MEKRYYWMKFQRDFFKSLRIKRLRRLAGGDTFTIIYLKLQLLSITSEGILTYNHVFGSFAEEMAEEIDEDIDNVQITIDYLLQCGLMEETEEDTFFLPYAAENIGSECASAERVRNHRKRLNALHCNATCNASVTDELRLGNVEKEIEIDKEIDKERNTKERKPKFIAPTFEEIEAYCKERNNNVDPKRFFDYYESSNWKDQSGKPVKSWKQKMIAVWEKDNGRNDNNAKNDRPEELKELYEQYSHFPKV